MNNNQKEKLMEQTKDAMLLFSAAVEGFNKKANELNPQGGRRLTLTLNAEQLSNLVAEASKALSESPTQKVKLDIHVSTKVTNEGNRKFTSAIAFVRAGQEFGAKPQGGATGVFVPKVAAPVTTTKKY
jgi:hypothetical protein